MQEIPRLLAKVPLFRDLAPADVGRLAARARRLSFEPEEDVVRIGDAGHALYLLIAGRVRVLYPSRGAELELARLGPGDFFGEMALLDDKARSATVRALDRIELLTLDREGLRAAVLDHPTLAIALLEAMSARIRRADGHISELSDRVVFDGLTGLLNRRAFDERMAEQIDRHLRYGDPFSLILLDVDAFKGINDTLGHDTGDVVLAWVARVLREHTRAADIPFRVGGEEFAVLCPATGSETVRAAAERLVAVVGGARAPIDRELRVTISAGYASCPEHGERFEQLYRTADRALLAAKGAGRDRVAEPDRGPASDVTRD